MVMMNDQGNIELVDVCILVMQDLDANTNLVNDCFLFFEITSVKITKDIKNAFLKIDQKLFHFYIVK